MRGQTKSARQQQVVNRLLARGWREGDLFNKHVPMYKDQPYKGLPNPCVASIDREGGIYRGYPRSKNYRGKLVK